MPNGRRPTTIQSVDRAAAILKALAGGQGRLGVSELADRLGLARVVEEEFANVGAELQIEILGERKRATVLVDSPYDPENKELRA